MTSDAGFWVDRTAQAIIDNNTSINEEVALRTYSDFRAAVATRLSELGHSLLGELMLGGESRRPAYRASDFDNHCRILVPDFASVNEELAAFLVDHPEYLDQIPWRRFEELLDAVFRNQGYTVELGPGQADFGVDLRLISKDSIGKIVTLVQAKRYHRDRRVTLEAVAALEGILDSNQAHRGLLVTTADFQPVARAFATTKSYRPNPRLKLPRP